MYFQGLPWPHPSLPLTLQHLRCRSRLSSRMKWRTWLSTISSNTALSSSLVSGIKMCDICVFERCGRCQQVTVTSPTRRQRDKGTPQTTMSDILEIPAPADFHVHLRQDEMCSLVTPLVRRGGFKLAYVMVSKTPSFPSRN